MQDLSEVVRNPEVVVNALGSWPSLHDAEIVEVRLQRDGPPAAVLVVKAMPYNPSGTVPIALLTFRFKGIHDLRLIDFNEQNVIGGLGVEPDNDGNRLVISPTYGLTGGFSFSEAAVLKVEAL